MNLASVLLLAAILVCFVLAVRYLLRHKGGCSGCGGDCANCKNHCDNPKN